jgi:hypothetical protein
MRIGVVLKKGGTRRSSLTFKHRGVKLVEAPPWSWSLARGALEGSVIVTATIKIWASSCDVGYRKGGVFLMMFCNPGFVGEEMPKQCINRKGLHTSGYRSDKWVIFWTQTTKEIGGELSITDLLSGSGKSGGGILDLVIII